jgi:hypothetical protein
MRNRSDCLLVQRDQPAQLGDRLGQTPPLEAREQLAHADRRVLEVEPHLMQRSQDFVRLIVQASAYERVRMLRLDAMGCERVRWEVAQIDGDNDAPPWIAAASTWQSFGSGSVSWPTMCS